MSGSVKSNVFGTSGTIAAAAGGLKWEAVVTASTVTVESNRGYFINTTSNACTITLPASPGVGDQIIFLDYARTWDTNAITIDSNGNDFQNQADNYIVDYDTEGQGLNIVFSGSTIGWIPNSDIANGLDHVNTAATQKGIIAFGENGSSALNKRILINSSGVLASIANGAGTARSNTAGAGYGRDKGIVAFGYAHPTYLNASNLVNNSGVVGSDVTGVGTVRQGTQGTTFAFERAIFAFAGVSGGHTAVSNLVTNAGVVGSDVTAVGTARVHPGAVTFGSDGQALFAFGGGGSGTYYNLKNLVSNQGVIAADASSSGTTQDRHQGVRYGTGLAIFAYGQRGTNTDLSLSNKVNTSGVVASDVTGVGTGAYGKVGSSFGADKGIFYGGRNETNSAYLTESNIVSNSGVVASSVANSGNTTLVGAAGLGYSQTA